MAVNEQANEKAQRIKTLIDAYSIGVRGGVITPCLADENWFRGLFGLGAADENVIAEWNRTNGVRMPITLQKGLADAEADAPQNGGNQN